MTTKVSKLGEYLVEGNSGITVASKVGHYVVEGTEKRVIVSKLAQYVVEGPPLIIPPAPRRRPLIMP
ncbi:hypothetical protein SR41_04595 [Sphingomonas melonis]|uniref:Uncharacterized protein n=1 Tax=Sphingomonas melonis TaxID=152682 RepID=A0A0D1MFV5_9SPHN|nr:hypothetical protein [Sphingomonas melonis]KIU29292.1 hypothetical protein SR41_04595 [Sphingomonas melonis]